MTVTQVKVFGGAATEKVVGYTATMLRLMDCGLTRPFHDLLRTHGALYREVSGLEWHEGGASGVIRGHEVLVGTSAYMHLMEVPLPPGHSVKNAVYCAINGQLAGLFLLEYAMSGAVNPSLSALMKAGAAPVLATRWGLISALAGSVIGLCLTFYLTSVGAFASLTAANFLVFMAAWLVPQALIANWVNQY